MIEILNAQTVEEKKIDLFIPSSQHLRLDASHLLLLPALIDPHVHFRTPGMEYKEDWRTAANASLKGGYTTVFDMPNTLPPTVTEQALREKKSLIDQQLKEVNIPLRYELFFGADKKHFEEIQKVKKDIIGIKVFMGCSTGGLVIDDDESLEIIFQLASENDLLVAVHAEDEKLLKEEAKKFPLPQPYAVHSKIRHEKVAMRAVEKACNLAKKYNTRLYILHLSTREELILVEAARKAGVSVYVEITPHHLFLNTDDYDRLQGKGVMNPPLRNEMQQTALWEGINQGWIDTVGSDHAPHTLKEKEKPYGDCPSGVPGIETTLPLLLNAFHDQKITLAQIVNLTSIHARSIFRLPSNNDWVLVDLEEKRLVSQEKLKTKCGWSPFEGQLLKGWPQYTILNGHCYDLKKM